MARLSASERGYGTRHKQLRREWRREVESGVVDCARCHRLIHPDELWDLGHDDRDRSLYWGPEHRRCNRATAGRRRKPAEVVPVRRQSREW